MKKIMVTLLIFSTSIQAAKIPPFQIYTQKSGDPLIASIMEKKTSDALFYLRNITDDPGLSLDKSLDKLGRTYLNAAVYFNITEIAEKLINEKAMLVNLVDNLGITPLMMAVFKESQHFIDLLIREGAKPNQGNAAKLVPLMIAAYFNRAAVIPFLVGTGADVNIQDNEGKTPLMYAIQTGSIDAIKALLDQGADPFIKDTQGDDASHYIDDARARGIVENIVQEMEKIFSKFSSSPLSRSILNDDREGVIKYATQEYIDETDMKGITPLIYSLTSQKDEFTKILLDKGADPTKLDEHGYMPFVEAGRATLDILKEMAPLVKNANILDGYGKTALHVAAEEGRLENITYLVEDTTFTEKANVNATNNHGETPLMKAVESKKLVAPRYLLEHGARINQQDNNGNTALTQLGRVWAFDPNNDFSEIGDLLFQYGADPYLKGTDPGSQSFASLASQSFFAGTKFYDYFQEYKEKEPDEEPVPVEELQKLLLDLSINLHALDNTASKN